MSLANRFPFGSIAHAGTDAVRKLGAEAVGSVLGLGKTAVYNMCDAGNTAYDWGKVPVAKALDLANELRRHQLPEFFTPAFARFDGAVSLPTLEPMPHPMQALARIQALQGRVCELFCRSYERAAGRASVLSEGDRRALVDAVDQQIDELSTLRNRLLVSTTLPALPLGGEGWR